MNIVYLFIQIFYHFSPQLFQCTGVVHLLSNSSLTDVPSNISTITIAPHLHLHLHCPSPPPPSPLPITIATSNISTSTTPTILGPSTISHVDGLIFSSFLLLYFCKISIAIKVILFSSLPNISRSLY